MNRTERLLDLIALMLDASEPVSWAEIREAFPDEYNVGSDEACERKFERDKAELSELGISLDYRPPSDDGQEGYVLNREDYYLPEIDFSPEEVAVLYAAGSAALSSGAFPGREDLAHALRKIAFVSTEDPDAAPSRLFVEHGKSMAAVAAHLETLWQALVSRKRVKLSYRGPRREDETVREVDAWGVCLRRGVWVLYGYCHLRKAERLFHVDRITAITVNKGKPRSPDYDVPSTFEIAAIAREQVWEHRFHAPLQVEIALAEELAPLADRLFPGGEKAGDDGARITVRATYLDGLLRQLLPLGDRAKVVGPAKAVIRVKEMLALLDQAHDGAPRERVA